MTSVDNPRQGREIPGLPGTFSRAFKPPPIREVPFTANERHARRQIGLDHTARRFAMGQATIFIAREPAGANEEMLWHLSISLPHRHPDWDEIKYARYKLLPPDLCFGILLPPPHLFLNVAAQDHVFHLWEIVDLREPWGGE